MELAKRNPFILSVILCPQIVPTRQLATKRGAVLERHPEGFRSGKPALRRRTGVMPGSGYRF